MVSTNRSIYIDANVLLEALLERKRQATAEAYLLSHAADRLYISALTGHLVTHFGGEFHQLSVLKQFLADYTILPLETIDFEWAFTNIRNNDFEDALQLAVAIHHGCNIFMTLDQPLYKAYRDLASIQVEMLR